MGGPERYTGKSADLMAVFEMRRAHIVQRLGRDAAEVQFREMMVAAFDEVGGMHRREEERWRENQGGRGREGERGGSGGGGLRAKGACEMSSEGWREGTSGKRRDEEEEEREVESEADSARRSKAARVADTVGRSSDGTEIEPRRLLPEHKRPGGPRSNNSDTAVSGENAGGCWQWTPGAGKKQSRLDQGRRIWDQKGDCLDTEGARKSFAVGGGHAAPSTSAAPRIQAASSHPSAAEAAGLQLHFQVGVGTHLRGQ
eukprot:1272070-Rhodomonas_salina.1